jgi:virulence-associated protein VapD
MYAIAFDLTIAEAKKLHPRGVTAADADISATLGEFNFYGVQGSVYVCDSEDMANLFRAITALKALPWFAASVRDIRAIRIEQWSDFTSTMRSA